MPDILTEECPFCHNKTIKIMHKEGSFSAQRTRCRAGRSTQYIKNPERNEILSGCSICGKSKEDVEKALKAGKEPSHEEVIRRLREAGLDPSKLK
jgi:heterodisulfide reductase subunit B